MSYVTLDPLQDISPFIQARSLNTYSQEVIKNIKMVTFFHNGLANIFGSYIYRIQKYPGDIDLVETFTECCTIPEVISKFIVSLKRVVTNILNEKNHFFSEFKAGFDNGYNINIGECILGYYFPAPGFAELVEKMHRQKLLNDEEAHTIFSVLDLQTHDGWSFDTISQIFRKHLILRWTAQEILNGFKIIRGQKVLLEQALKQKTFVKIDMIAHVDGRFVEVTNFIGLVLKKKDNTTWININVDIEANHEVLAVLPFEVERLYFSDFYYSPFKMIKRMFSLSRSGRNAALLNLLIDVISSNISLLYQLKSQIESIVIILEKAPTVPNKLIFNQLDNMKHSFSSILQFTPTQINIITQTIDEVNSLDSSSRSNRIVLLENLNKKIIKPMINGLSISYLNEKGLNPPPTIVLPGFRTYANLLREPGPLPEYSNYRRKPGSIIPAPPPIPNYYTQVQAIGYTPNRYLEPGFSQQPAILQDTYDSNVFHEALSTLNTPELSPWTPQSEPGTPIPVSVLSYPWTPQTEPQSPQLDAQAVTEGITKAIAKESLIKKSSVASMRPRVTTRLEPAYIPPIQRRVTTRLEPAYIPGQISQPTVEQTVEQTAEQIFANQLSNRLAQLKQQETFTRKVVPPIIDSYDWTPQPEIAIDDPNYHRITAEERAFLNDPNLHLLNMQNDFAIPIVEVPKNKTIQELDNLQNQIWANVIQQEAIAVQRDQEKEIILQREGESVAPLTKKRARALSRDSYTRLKNAIEVEKERFLQAPEGPESVEEMRVIAHAQAVLNQQGQEVERVIPFYQVTNPEFVHARNTAARLQNQIARVLQANIDRQKFLNK
jgi:hypothetical protein